MYRVPGWLFIAVSVAALSSFAGVGAAHAQDSGESLTAVCVSSFESPIVVRYLTDEQITAIEALVDDGTDIPPPKIVGYPDPETGSCATENGELKAYDPEHTTPICVPSGPEGNGPLIVMFYSNHYLPSYAAYNDVILADPETGVCPGQEISDTAVLVESLVEKLRDILREVLG